MKNIVMCISIIFIYPNVVAKSTWNVIPIVNLDAVKNPIKCGYLYESSLNKIVLKLEKFVVNNHVITSFSVKNPDIKKQTSVRLLTKTVDTSKNFKTQSNKKGKYTATANLEKSDTGGKLFYELAIFGGVLKINNLEYQLPSRLPRATSALYLNCAGDLIRPDNEIK